MPSRTQLPVSAAPVANVRLNNTPSGASTRTSTLAVPSEVHDNVVVPG